MMSMVLKGPPSPRPSPPGEGARCPLAFELSQFPRSLYQNASRAGMTARGAASNFGATPAFFALPLLGERVGVRADRKLPSAVTFSPLSP